MNTQAQAVVSLIKESKPAPARKKSSRVQYHQRSKDKPRLNKWQLMAKRRMAELMSIFKDDFPGGLPHNERGKRFARYVIRTMAMFATFEERQLWLHRYAGWLNADEQSDILNLPPHWYSGAYLGDRLELYDAHRAQRNIRTIDAFDVTREERVTINRAKDQKRKEAARRSRGAKPREQYETQSLSRTQPWKSEGISRSTWERRRRKSVDASPSGTSLVVHITDTLASNRKPFRKNATATGPLGGASPANPALAANPGNRSDKILHFTGDHRLNAEAA
jgi:hypothetical protein